MDCFISLFQFDRAVRLFGEDNSSIQPEDFFVIFDTFLTTLHEAKLDNENMKRKREEEEKRMKQDAEVMISHITRFSIITIKREREREKNSNRVVF